MKKLMLAVAAVAVVLGAKAEAETVIFVNATSETITDSARYWNKVSFIPSNLSQRRYELKDKDANTTTVAAWVFEPGAGTATTALKTGCTGDAAEFSELNKGCAGEEPYAAEEGYNNTRRPAMRMRLTGLDPAKYYTFSFYGSRTADSGKIFKTVFSATGTSSGSATLNVSGNSTKVAKVLNILPTPDGFVEISVRGADDSTNKFGFFQGLKIESFSLRQPTLVREFFVDAYGTPAADPDRSWNAVSFASKTSKKLIDSIGNATDIQLSVTTNVADYNQYASRTFTGDATEFNAARSADNRALYGQGTTTKAYMGATISGLDPARLYAVTFVGSRMSGTGKIVGLYSVFGTTTASATLDANNNSSKVAAVPAVSPRTDGTIDLRLQADASNTTSQKYYNLVALKISEYRSEDDFRWASAKATDGGSVAVTVGGETSESAGWFPDGTTLTATATPDAGWKFVEWTSDWKDDPVATATIEISAMAGKAANWTAVFEKDEAYMSRAAYFDAYGTPASDTKVWNKIQTQLCSHNGRLEDIRTSTNGRTPLVITVDQELEDSYNPSATKAYSDDALPFRAATSSDGRQLYSAMYSSGSGLSVLQWSFVVSGLNPTRLYTFKFAGSRVQASNDYDTIYRAVGANEVQTRFNPANNVNKVATLANVRPAADGTIRIESSPSPDNDHTQFYTYLSAFSIEGDIKIPGQGLIIVIE